MLCMQRVGNPFFTLIGALNNIEYALYIAINPNKLSLIVHDEEIPHRFFSLSEH